MQEWLFLFLYGSLFLVGLFLAPFWGALARRRARRVAGRWSLRSDRYFVLASAICILAIGDTILFGTRAVVSATIGLTASERHPLAGIGIGIGVGIIMCGKILLVWLADLEREPQVWTWTRWLTATTMAWAVLAGFVEIAEVAI